MEIQWHSLYLNDAFDAGSTTDIRGEPITDCCCCCCIEVQWTWGESHQDTKICGKLIGAGETLNDTKGSLSLGHRKAGLLPWKHLLQLTEMIMNAFSDVSTDEQMFYLALCLFSPVFSLCSNLENDQFSITDVRLCRNVIVTRCV